MAERYTRLFTLSEDLYTPGAPLVIAAGALLKDTQTGQVLAQLKLRSISDRPINAVDLQVIGYDMSKSEICREEHQYLDLKVSRDDMFGSKEAILMSRPSVRSFSVRVIAVYFADGDRYLGPEERWTSLPEQQDLNSRLFDTELIRQYKLETSERSRYVPMEYLDLWLCSCGEINHTGEPCYRCGRCLEDEKQFLNVELLRKRKTERLQAEAGRAAQEEARKKTSGYRVKRLASILIPFLIIAAGAAAVWFINSAREQSYSNAVALYDAGDYAGAAKAYTSLGEFQDSSERAETNAETDRANRYASAKALLKEEKLLISPLAYIRGRSLGRVFFICDEAQNLTPNEIKTIITRAGEGTKMVFTGDIFQIDQPYLDQWSNGLTHLSEKMNGQKLFEHVFLRIGERSELSDLASKLL